MTDNNQPMNLDLIRQYFAAGRLDLLESLFDHLHTCLARAELQAKCYLHELNLLTAATQRLTSVAALTQLSPQPKSPQQPPKPQASTANMVLKF